MIDWPDHSEEIPSYQFVELPKPAGYWILYAEGPADIRFTMLYKPPWLQRWFTNKLLGWTWKDAK